MDNPPPITPLDDLLDHFLHLRFSHQRGPLARRILLHSQAPLLPSIAGPLREAVLAIVAISVSDAVDAELNWTEVTVQWVHQLRSPWQESAVLCSDAAWHARRARRSALQFIDPWQLVKIRSDAVSFRTQLHLYLAACRYDFRCAKIDDLLLNLPLGLRNRLDPFSLAHHAFALLGQSQRAGLVLMQDVLARANDHPAVLHTLLHGLALGHELPNQAELMFELLSRPAFANGTDPVALYRQAYAFRRVGEHKRAMESITRALELLAPDDPMVHADFVRERSLIAAGLNSSPADIAEPL